MALVVVPQPPKWMVYHSHNLLGYSFNLSSPQSIFLKFNINSNVITTQFCTWHLTSLLTFHKFLWILMIQRHPCWPADIIHHDPQKSWGTWVLTLLVLTLEYSKRFRSIPWLLLPWLLTSPGHQQPWYWLCSINGSLSSTRKNFNYMYYLSVEK